MKTTSCSTAWLLFPILLASSGFAANVVQMTISKANSNAEVTRRDLDMFTESLYQRGTISEDLLNNITGGSYMAAISVGSPAQSISLVIDTGSSDVFLLADTADQCTSVSLQTVYGGCVGGTCEYLASSALTFIGF